MPEILAGSRFNGLPRKRGGINIGGSLVLWYGIISPYIQTPARNIGRF